MPPEESPAAAVELSAYDEALLQLLTTEGAERLGAWQDLRAIGWAGVQIADFACKNDAGGPLVLTVMQFGPHLVRRDNPAAIRVHGRRHTTENVVWYAGKEDHPDGYGPGLGRS